MTISRELLQKQTSRRTVLSAAALLAAVPSVARWHTGMAQDGGTPVRGGSITVAAVGPASSLDPFTSNLASGDGMSYMLLYNTMGQGGPDGVVGPELASEWTVSEDGLTYTFTLVSGATFSDGSPVNAEAVKFNLDRNRAEGSTYSGVSKLQVISDVVATDETTLTVTLSEPNAPFLAAVCAVPVVSPTGVETLGEDLALQGSGSGPFILESWTPGSTAVFKRNENYWQTDANGEPLPYLDEVVLEGVSDDSVRLLNLRSGTFHINERVEPRDRPQLASDSSLQLIEYSAATCYQLALNVTQAPFDNQALRQAVQFAVDREAIIQNIGFGSGYTIALPFPKEAWFWIESPQATYDPEQAKAKLTEAGYPDGIDITLSIINRPLDNQISQIVKPFLDAVNIRTTIDVLERTTWVDLWNARGGEMGILQRGTTPLDPDDQSAWFQPSNTANFAGYDTPEILALIGEANRTTDQEARKASWQQIAEIVLNDAVYIFIGAVPTVGAMRTEVKDLRLNNGSAVDPSSPWKEQ